MNRCLHGMLAPRTGPYTASDVCAMCKGWPSIDTMRRQFPSLSREMFLVMTPEERISAVKTGVLEGFNG